MNIKDVPLDELPLDLSDGSFFHDKPGLDDIGYSKYKKGTFTGIKSSAKADGADRRYQYPNK